jgi:hypothetical protein
MEKLSQVELPFPHSFVVNFVVNLPSNIGKSAFDEVHDKMAGN